MPRNVLKRVDSNVANMEDILNLFKRVIKNEINCHAVATVKKFNHVIDNDVNSASFNTMQTADVQINYSLSQYKKNVEAGNFQAYPNPYPLLVQCPVIILGGGDGSLTFPIKEGDQCFVLFNDRDIQNWFAGARSGELATTFQHMFSDAIILVGFQNFLGTYDEERAVLQKDKAKVGVGKDNKVLIQSDTLTLGGEIGTLTDVLNTFFTTSSTAVTAAQIAAAAATALSSMAALDFGDLLE